MIRSVRSGVSAALCACAVVSSAVAAPLGTGFTYQGQLKLGGTPVNAAKTLRFSLWDAQSTSPGVGGNQIGNRQTVSDIPVSDGLFTVSLNAAGEFGPAAFNGDARFLQIELCSSGCAVVITLSPRQALTATPYALAIRGIVVNNAGQVGVGTASPQATLHVGEGSSGIAPNPNAALAVERGSHNFLSLLAPDASVSGVLFGNPTNGTAAGGVLFNSPETPNGLQFRTNTNDTQMVITSGGNVGIGTDAPATELHLVDSGTARIRVESTAGQAGISFLSDSTGENVVYSPDATDDLRFNVNGSDRMAITSAGEVGIGTNAPSERLTVSGNIHVTGEVRRPATGNANILPLCYGHILEDGTIASGSGNFSVNFLSGTRTHVISVTGENFGVGATGYTFLVQPMNSSGPLIPHTSTLGGDLTVNIANLDGDHPLAEFSFVVFKP